MACMHAYVRRIDNSYFYQLNQFLSFVGSLHLELELKTVNICPIRSDLKTTIFSHTSSFFGVVSFARCEHKVGAQLHDHKKCTRV